MRQQPTVKKPTAARSAQPKAKQPQVRSLIKQHPAKKLSALILQAKAPLEAELSKAHLSVNKSLTLFLSFTDGLQRATVVQFSGKHLAEVWKKLADWQQRKFKESPKVRWLRIDWVTETRAMPWADCLKEMQSVKRNYFRYGVSLDTNFRYAFLEQELNANAMLYLGGNQPKAALNKKNFLSYGVKRYGKHFSLPALQDQALLFTTQAILVQPDKPHELLHGYSGGQEGRNTGRRIIEQLDPAQVTSLIQQSSQFLAEQVDAKGRFIYGIHPCFDREINAYNTLRHTSTTYSMLEAWEVTQSSELKSAIDRSIEHLTSQLIRQYRLPSGETLAYLQDSNNEIKLGGNAVCLLALVKYTELTNDQQYLPLMEQLALGIQRMQNQDTGQFHHVLNADDLSIKEEFRIIYYDGEAAFGLMRLYGLTKDERWLNTVVSAFEYFIEKDHWKTHDHWLSYCVNELTLYRPEERYYQFGIKNVSGHLNFVMGRITTFPTLLELMMAAHKMITRLETSKQHRHLLEQIDLKKFYRALEARAHYLLNGFFWPEFAIYFQNPQRIMGSFFIRHHSFRVRIDDVEHYLSGYVAYLRHYLSSAPEKQRAETITSTINTERNNITEVTALFLNQDIGERLTGIEHSALGRASLFIDELGINPVIVTFQYRPYLQHNVQQILNKKRYHPATRVIGLYDFIQGFQDLTWDRSGKNTSIPPTLDPTFPELTASPVKGFKDVRYLDKKGQLFAYKVYSKTHGKLIHINYFKNGKKIAADVFHATGHKSSRRLYDPANKKITHEIYYNPWGTPLFFRVFDRSETYISKPDDLNIGFHLLPSLTEEHGAHLIDKRQSIQFSTSPIGINTLNEVAKDSRYIGDNSKFSYYALQKLISRLQQEKVLLLCDKNKLTLEPAAQLRDKNSRYHAGKKIRIISVIHSTHYQGEETHGNIKSHYQGLLQSSEKADKIIVLTQSQLEDIQRRFPDEKLAAIPHTLPQPPLLYDHASSPLLQSGNIVYVARLSPEKNHLLALEIFAQLIKRVPEAKLYFYGEGSERRKIEERIGELQLDNNVVLEGYCTDVAHIYQGAHCAILTSKMEGFSLSLIEAMAFKCPTVAFDINYGPRDLISHGETGFLVPYGDQSLFVQYLFNILTQPKLANDLGWQAHERFSKNFSHKRIAERWKEAIADIF
ncbi:glycosyltransferase [Vreelandella alkaliphila]|uniref:glycosyltransferase n=1 Tax=Vreelandella alkaliphila TaxID=272774 RepID=UPI003FD80FDB